MKRWTTLSEKCKRNHNRYSTPTKMAKIRKTDDTKCGRACGNPGALALVLRGGVWAPGRFWKTIWKRLTKLNVHLICVFVVPPQLSPWRNENICPQKASYGSVCARFICVNPKLETNAHLFFRFLLSDSLIKSLAQEAAPLLPSLSRAHPSPEPGTGAGMQVQAQRTLESGLGD